jgi:uncharacterized protein (TIGR02646 family)
MRRLSRPSVSVPTLAEIRVKHPFNKRGSPRGAPDGKWNNADVRGAVFAMHGRVCAYCQRPASDSRGDIEHFRPKSIYPWLTYDFGNYLLGCRVCNSNRKSNRFPLLPRAKPVIFKQRMADDRTFLVRALSKEKRLLIDPVDDPVEEWFTIDYGDPLCPIELTDSGKHNKLGKKRGPTTIEFFGLNLIPELIEDRFNNVNEVLDLLEKWRDGDLTRGDELRARANRYRPHGWAIRRVLAELAPTLEMPSGQEDLKWFVDECWGAASPPMIVRWFNKGEWRPAGPWLFCGRIPPQHHRP